MNIVTHFFIGWNSGLRLGKTARDTALLTLASVIPDIDAFGAIIDLARGGEAEFFSEYHHKFGHCGLFCLILLPFAWWGSRRNWRMVVWSALLFHLHLLCDIAGARGPDEYQWPIYYFWPFSDTGITWSGQWQINAWPNILLTCLLLLDFCRQSAFYGYTPFLWVAKKLDHELVATFKKWTGAVNAPD